MLCSNDNLKLKPEIHCLNIIFLSGAGAEDDCESFSLIDKSSPAYRFNPGSSGHAEHNCKYEVSFENIIQQVKTETWGPLTVLNALKCKFSTIMPTWGFILARLLCRTTFIHRIFHSLFLTFSWSKPSRNAKIVFHFGLDI